MKPASRFPAFPVRAFALTAFLATAAALWLSPSAGAGEAPPDAAPPPADPVLAGGFTVSGPYTHENLTVFLLHGKEADPGAKYLTLQEGLDAKKVVVHETGNVNELSIENLSEDVPVFLNSGDIVKGGRQDRVVAYDLVLPPKSGKMPLAAFCVEHGRWSRRGGESDREFSKSDAQLTSKELKLAAKKAASQREVWDKVAEAQEKLEKNVGAPVKEAASRSSLQLTLENKKVEETTEAYVKALAPAVEGKADAVGFAFAINGKLNNVDIYATRDLFLKLWPKLVKAAAVEAVCEVEKEKKFDPASAESVKACIEDADKGKAEKKKIGGQLEMVTQETDKNLLFETRTSEDAKGEKKESWIHKNYLTR